MDGAPMAGSRVEKGSDRRRRLNDDRQRFGWLLANALKARAMKQEHLAGLLGTTQSSVSGWINGKYEPSAATVFTIERSLGMDPGYLSRPLGYLPVDANSGPVGVVAAIAASPLDEDEKAVMVSMYELLAAKAASPAASAGALKVPAARSRPTPGPAAKRPAPAPPVPQRVAGSR